MPAGDAASSAAAAAGPLEEQHGEEGAAAAAAAASSSSWLSHSHVADLLDYLLLQGKAKNLVACSDEHEGLLYSMASTLWSHLGLDQLTGTTTTASTISSDDDDEGDHSGSVSSFDEADDGGVAFAAASRVMTPSASSSSLASSVSSFGSSAADLTESVDRPSAASATSTAKPAARSPRPSTGSSSGASASASASSGRTAKPLSPDQPLMACYRPLLFYVLMEAIAGWCHMSLTLRMGFVKAAITPTATYYVKKGLKRNKPPLVMLHGIGVGLAPYLAFLTRLSARTGRTIIAVQYKHVSMRLTANVPSAAQVAADVEAFLAAQGFGPVHLVAHSYGTLVASAFVKRSNEQQQSRRVAGLTLLDPVCFAMYLPHLLRNSLFFHVPKNTHHPTPSTTSRRQGSVGSSAKQQQQHKQRWNPLRGVVVRDVHVAAALSRKTHWSEVNMWVRDLPEHAPTTVVMSGDDHMVPVDAVLGMLSSGLAAQRGVRVQVHPGRGHGAFVLDPDMQDSIIVSLGGIPAQEEARRTARRALLQQQQQQQQQGLVSQLTEVAAALHALAVAVREGRLADAGELVSAALLRMLGPIGAAAAASKVGSGGQVLAMAGGPGQMSTPPQPPMATSGAAGRVVGGRRAVVVASGRELRLRRARSADTAAAPVGEEHCQGCCGDDNGSSIKGWQGLLRPPPDLIAFAADAEARPRVLGGKGWQEAAQQLATSASLQPLASQQQLWACACACHGDGDASGGWPRCPVHASPFELGAPHRQPAQQQMRGAGTAVVGGGAGLVVPPRGLWSGRQLAPPPQRQMLRYALSGGVLATSPPASPRTSSVLVQGGVQPGRRAAASVAAGGGRVGSVSVVAARAQGIVRGAKALLGMPAARPV